MSYNGSGTFNINSAGQPVVAGTVISATAFNALTADLGVGLSTAITKDGQTTTTARITFAQGVTSSLTTDSSSTSTGSIITAGGVGIAKALFVGTTANFAGVTTFSAGTAALPAITTTGDTNTGIYFPAADTIAFTEGGVESMRIDNNGNLLVGVTIGSGFRQRITQSAGNWLHFNSDTVEAKISGGSTWNFNTDSGNPISFSISSTEQMRLTSTGLGIGTSSPSQKLHVNSAGAAIALIQSTQVAGNTNVETRYTSTNRTWGVGQNIIQTSSIFEVADITANATRLAINSSGNVGIGTSSPSNRFTVADNSASAMIYGTQSGAGDLFALANSASEKFRITNAGDVGIGTASPAGNLQISGSGDRSLLVTGGTSGTVSVQLGDSGAAGQGGMSYDNSVDALFFKSNGSERMRIDSSGNVGIGTSSPSGKLEVYDATSAVARVTAGTEIFEIRNTGSEVRLAVVSADPLTFRTSNVEAMRIDSSGRLLVGVTSPVGSTFSTIQYAGATYNGLGIIQSDNSSGARFMLFSANSAQCGVIDRVGTTSAVVYTATSDRRLKENIVDAPSAIEHINAVKVRSYNWIDGGHQVKYGVIAQEFVDVEPDAVVQGDTGEAIEKTWSVDTSALVPAMIKAIQEQQTLIQDLTTRLAALESKA